MPREAPIISATCWEDILGWWCGLDMLVVGKVRLEVEVTPDLGYYILRGWGRVWSFQLIVSAISSKIGIVINIFLRAVPFYLAG